MDFFLRDGILARSLSDDRCPVTSLSVTITNLSSSLTKPCFKLLCTILINFLLGGFSPEMKLFGKFAPLSNSENRFKTPFPEAVKITSYPALCHCCMSASTVSYLFA